MSYIKQDEGGGGDTYTLRAAQSGADVDIQLDAATGSDSDVKLKAGTNITLTEASDTITIDASAGINGITVQDEGTPLSTLATTLNFAGAGVVASGTGATKTITVAGGGGGGMLPPGIPTGNTDTGDETMGFMNGLLAGSTASAGIQQWSNTLTRIRPHVFSRTDTISTARFAVNSGPSGAVSQVVSFGLYNTNSNGQPTTLKCLATQQITVGSGSAVYTPSWVAESGQDLNVTAGDRYWCGYFTSYSSTSSAANFYFADSTQLSPIFIDMDSTPKMVQTTYASGVFPSPWPSLGSNPGDTSGNTWIIWQVVY